MMYSANAWWRASRRRTTTGVQAIAPWTPASWRPDRFGFRRYSTHRREDRRHRGRESVKTVARKLRDHQATNIVVDPVMVATSGSSLAADDTIAEEISSLFPIATVITPNIPEAQVLAQMPIGNQADMETAAVQLAKDYAPACWSKAAMA